MSGLPILGWGIRFYPFDNHQRHHHDYWTHIPGIWLLIIFGWGLISRLLERPFGLLPTVFFAAVFSHLVLDTMAGEIEWLWPFFDEGFNLVTVPALQANWYLSFLMHWTFLVEVFISLAGLRVALRGDGYKDTKDEGAITGQAEAG